MLLAGSFGQRLLKIFTALSPFYVEQPHGKGSALYKYPTNGCKNNIERSTNPNLKVINCDYSCPNTCAGSILVARHAGYIVANKLIIKAVITVA
jgi:hypothetical protein